MQYVQGGGAAMSKGMAAALRGNFALMALVLCTACAGVDAATVPPEWRCPAGFTPREGLNTDFPSDGQLRAFVVIPPAQSDGPAPVWTPLTGTVEATNDNLHVL